MLDRRRLIAVILCAMMVMAAGCAGWGTDGPAGEYADDNTSDGYGDGEAQAQEENESNESNDSYSEESDAGAQSSSEPSDGDSEDSYSSMGDSDESTDETGQTGDGASQSESGVGSNVTCSEFDSHAEAQAYYEEDSDARTSLDADNDGVACESLQESASSEDGTYTYSLTVQVVDEDGNPVENELVQIGMHSVEGPGESYITDANGEVTMSYTADTQNEYQDFDIRVRGETRKTVLVRAGEMTEQVVVSDDSERETYQLDVYAGEVYPVEDVTVTIERWDGASTTKTTGEDGLARFEVYPGDYEVTAVTPRGEEHYEEITVEEDRGFFLPFSQPAPDRINTTITVVDQNGNPVEGVTVQAMTTIPPAAADVYIQSEPTDANGQVTVEAHANQTYGSVVVEGPDGTQYDHGGQTFETDGDGVTITVERPDGGQQQSALAVA